MAAILWPIELMALKSVAALIYAKSVSQYTCHHRNHNFHGPSTTTLLALEAAITCRPSDHQWGCIIMGRGHSLILEYIIMNILYIIIIMNIHELCVPVSLVSGLKRVMSNGGSRFRPEIWHRLRINLLE